MGFYYIDGRELPSVTTILKVIDKPALMNWAARQGAKAVLLDSTKYDTPEKAAAAIYQISDSAMSRGSEAHKVAEAYVTAYVQGKADEFVSDNPYFPAIRAFFQTMRPEVIYWELRLVNMEHGYAGTADLIARVGPKTFVIDYKTSKAVYDEYRLQVEAYRRCTMAILSDGTRVALKSPITDGGAVVLLKDDGTFAWQEVTSDHTVFLAAMIIFQWKQALNGTRA